MLVLHRSFSRAALFTAMVALAACGESVKEWIDQRRPAMVEQLARIDRVRELAHSEPRVEWPSMRDPGRLAICELVVPAYREAGCDTWVIDQAQLDAPGAFLDPPQPIRYGQGDWLVMSKALTETGRFPPNKSYPDGDAPDRLTRPIIYAFEQLLQTRFVIVVRTEELVRPRLAEDQKSYDAGKFRGDAILYQLLPEPHSLGVVPFAYVQAGDLKVRMRHGGIDAAQIDKAFADGVRQALAEALVDRLHNLERPPAAPGPAN